MSERSDDYQLHAEFESSAWSTLEKGGAASVRSEFDFHQSFLSTETNYLSERVQDRIKNDDQLTEEDKEIIQYLALRKFHMYVGCTMLKRDLADCVCRQPKAQETRSFRFSNNHPFLCFYLADKRHPLGSGERLINLVASLAFGLAATCSVVLWFHYEENRSFDNLAFTIPLVQYDVSVGMLALLMFSGPLHVVFDLSIYFLQACPPCRVNGLFEKYNFPEWHQRCWLWLGTHVAFLVTVGSMALAVNVALIRASIADDGDGVDITYKVQHYDFMLLYMLEVIVANFVVFPMGTFTVFSGVLGCGRIPGLGGRPYQVRKHQRFLDSQRRASF